MFSVEPACANIYILSICYHNILPQTGQHCPGGTTVPTPGGQIGRKHKTTYVSI